MAGPVRRSPAGALLVPVVAALVVAAAGWLLLLLVKGAVVLTAYAVGALLVVVPLLLAPRLLRGPGRRRRVERTGWVAATVLLGLSLLAVAHLVSRHGWLLVAVPGAVVGITRLAAGLQARRVARR